MFDAKDSTYQLLEAMAAADDLLHVAWSEPRSRVKKDRVAFIEEVRSVDEPASMGGTVQDYDHQVEVDVVVLARHGSDPRAADQAAWAVVTALRAAVTVANRTRTAADAVAFEHIARTQTSDVAHGDAAWTSTVTVTVAATVRTQA